MHYFTGFNYQFFTFVDTHLRDIIEKQSRELCFDEIFELKFNIDKSIISRRIKGESKWNNDEKNQINQRAYTLFLEWIIDKTHRINVCNSESSLIKLQREFEDGNVNNALHMQGNFEKEYICAIKVNNILKKLVVAVQNVSRTNAPEGKFIIDQLYAFGAFSVLWYFVNNGADVPFIPKDISALIETKNTQPFTDKIITILSASYPDKRASNTDDKSVLFTRYALFTLIKKEFPNERQLLDLLSDDKNSPEVIENRIVSLDIANIELSNLFSQLKFDWHYNDNGKRTDIIIIGIKNNTSNKCNHDKNTLKHSLETLFAAYMELPMEFHNNVKSYLKREINTTVSQLTLATAYEGIFNISEQTRAELLTICDSLVNTHNHHNSYLYALFEKTRDEGAYLFKRYHSDDHECRRAIDIIKNFFKDNFRAGQSASYFGKKFLLWCNDASVAIDLIDNCCYDQKIWLFFANSPDKQEVLRQTVRKRFIKNVNSNSAEYVNHILSFCQMMKGDFKFLAFSDHDKKYNIEVQNFIKYIIMHMPKFPREKHTVVGHAVKNLLLWSNGYDPNDERPITKKVLSELQVDWSLPCYKIIKELKEVIEEKPISNFNIQNVAAALVKYCSLPQTERVSSSNIDRSTANLRILLSDKSFVFDDETKKAANIVIQTIFEVNANKYYTTIFSTSARMYLFSETTVAAIVEYANLFLLKCDYAQQTHSVINSALSILKYNNFQNAEGALKTCFGKLSTIKKCRPIELLPILLEGMTVETIISILTDRESPLHESHVHTINWLLCEKRKELAESLEQNCVFEFVDALVERNIDNIFTQELSNSIVHFAKRQDCFADKVPTSDEFYSEILLEADAIEINYDYLKRKAREHQLSLNTALFHLCKVLKDHPKKTALVCVECLAKFYGQTEYRYFNPDANQIKENLMYQKRAGVFSLIISNPVIRNTTKLYCSRMRDFVRALPSVIIDLIKNVVNYDSYPAWFTDDTMCNIDIVEKQTVLLSKLVFESKPRPASSRLSNEIHNKLIPWLRKDGFKTEAYEPESFILTIRKNGMSYVIDGTRAISHYVEESAGYDDFNINVLEIVL